MIRLILTRRWYDDERTIGELRAHDGEFIAFTMEPGKKDTEAPRVATGFYYLKRHGWEENEGTRFRRTWCLIGRDCDHYGEHGTPRSTVLFHAGNRDQETAGCILLGEAITFAENEVSLYPSRPSMSRLRQFLGASDGCLVIRG